MRASYKALCQLAGSGTSFPQLLPYFLPEMQSVNEVSHPVYHQDSVSIGPIWISIPASAASSNHLQAFKTSDALASQPVRISAGGAQTAILTKTSKVTVLRSRA